MGSCVSSKKSTDVHGQKSRRNSMNAPCSPIGEDTNSDEEKKTDAEPRRFPDQPPYAVDAVDDQENDTTSEDSADNQSCRKVSSEDDISNEGSLGSHKEEDKHYTEGKEKMENKSKQESSHTDIVGLNIKKKDKNADLEEEGIESLEWQIPVEIEDQKETLRKIFTGHMNINVPSQIKLVRIFTSSTFTDTFVERNTLMERVYPKLKAYCQSKMHDFQVVDMRWGVRDEATDDHMTTELCMRELERCQKVSTGPNFITFLGQKYGYRPFPPRIYEKEFEVMLSYLEDDEDRELLEKWFKRDDNLVPAMFILQPIKDLIPNYNNFAKSAEERSKASNEWWKAFEKMQTLLRNAAESCLLNEEEIARYKISVTENEIRRGVMDVKEEERQKHCFWFKRNITNIAENLEKVKMRLFVDKDSDGVDEDAAELLRDLKSNLSAVLSDGNIKEYDVPWHGEGGIEPDDCEEHEAYIKELCEDFYNVLVDMIDKGIKEKVNDVMEDKLVQEILLHVATCHAKTTAFYGRQDVLDSILRHVAGDEPNRIVVVHGDSGCGKTSIMAVAARMIKEIHPDVPVVVRFLGTTHASSTIRDLIQSICSQIYRITAEDQPAFPESFRELMSYFENTLKKVKSKMVIMLDSLDQLSSHDGALGLKWIPKKIKKNLTVILSALPGEEYKVFPVLKARLPENAFIDVPEMPTETAGLILNACLKKAKHRITTKQREAVLNAFKECPLPLFLKLSFDQSLKWKSYTPENKINLPLSVKETIIHLFASLERLHGEKLVSRSLAYITAARNGLTDAEMDDILSLDDDVLNDVYQYWTPPIRRIPPLLWIRIKTDLNSYIVTRGSDGVLVNTWYHRQFQETAQERYLHESAAEEIHAKLAEYFVGKWSGGVQKLFIKKNGEEEAKDRLVSEQPNIFPKLAENVEIFNLRKLNELPHHLIRSKNIEALKKHVINNFDFLQTKLRALGWRSVLQDCKDAAKAFANDEEVELLRDCLQMSGEAILTDPYQLASQLNGRLAHFQNHVGIRELLTQSRSASVPCLYPSLACFESPGAAIASSLAGHTAMVNWACTSKNGERFLTISEDETMKLWDVTTGEEISSYDMETDYDIVKFYNDDKCVVVAGYYGMFAIELDTDCIVHEEESLMGFHGKCMDVISGETKLVHAGKEKIRVYGIKGKDIKLAWEYEEEAEKNPNGIEDMITGLGDFYGYTRGNEKELVIRRTDDKQFMKTLSMPYGLMHFKFHDSMLITLGTNSAFQETTEVHLVIWDCSTWSIIKDMESQFHPMISTLYDMTTTTTNNGTQLIWPVLNQINFWNIDTGEEQTTLRVSSLASSYKQALIGSGRRLAVVLVDINQRAIQVYNLDFLEFEEQVNDAEAEVSENLLGSGEKDAFLSHYNTSVILSISNSNAVINIWDARYQDQMKTVRIDSRSSPQKVEWIDDEHIALWDLEREKIACLDVVQGKVQSMTSGKVGDVLRHFGSSHYLGDYKILATSDVKNEINLWDLKAGELVKKYNIQRNESIVSFIVSEDGSTAVVSFSDESHGDSKLPAVCLDLNKEDVCSTICIENQWIRLVPEQTVLSSDGKILYVIFWRECIHVIDTATGSEVKRIWYTATDASEETKTSKNYTIFYCINVSSLMGYLVAYVTCQVMVGEEAEANNRLVVFDVETHEVVAWHDCAVYGSMQLSKDGSRMLCKSQAVYDQAMALELWDMSKVRDHKLTLVGRFLPDAKMQFSYLTLDGDVVCCGFTGIDGLVFLRPCGEEQQKKRNQSCTDVTIEFPDTS